MIFATSRNIANKGAKSDTPIVLNVISCFVREPLGYIKDPWNYFDIAGYVLISLTFTFKIMGNDHQWTFASFAFVINSLGIFKYSVRDRWVICDFLRNISEFTFFTFCITIPEFIGQSYGK